MGDQQWSHISAMSSYRGRTQNAAHTGSQYKGKEPLYFNPGQRFEAATNGKCVGFTIGKCNSLYCPHGRPHVKLTHSETATVLVTCNL